jgi:hypothetical protein
LRVILAIPQIRQSEVTEPLAQQGRLAIAGRYRNQGQSAAQCLIETHSQSLPRNKVSGGRGNERFRCEERILL